MRQTVQETISPSMDIQIASNFERLIYDLNDGDDLATINSMKDIKEKGKYTINQSKLDKINLDLSKIEEEKIFKTIKSVKIKFDIVLDPHSAIGYGAFDKVNLNGNNYKVASTPMQLNNP